MQAFNCPYLTHRLPYPDEASKATEYCLSYSDGISDNMKAVAVWDWAAREFYDSDKMSSELQGATNKFLAQLLKPKRSQQIELTESSKTWLIVGVHQKSSSSRNWQLLWVHCPGLARGHRRYSG